MSEPSTHDWQKVPEPVEGHGPVMQCTKCKMLKRGVGQPLIPCVPMGEQLVAVKKDGPPIFLFGEPTVETIDY